MNPNIIANVDKGLYFFCGLGVALIGLTIAEKCGVQINDKAVRIVTWTCAGASVLIGILTNPVVLLF